MRNDLLIGVLTIVAGGVGTWLMLPHRHGNATPRRIYATGALLAGNEFLAAIFPRHFGRPGAAEPARPSIRIL